MLGLAKRVKARSSSLDLGGLRRPDRPPQREDYRGSVNPIGPRACYDEGSAPPRRCSSTICAASPPDPRRPHLQYLRAAHAPNDGRVVSNFIVQALKGEAITVYGDGKQTRAFCYVDDLVEGSSADGGARRRHRPDHLGNPVETPVGALAEKIVEMIGSRSTVVYRPLPVDDPVQRCPDISRARTCSPGSRRCPWSAASRRRSAIRPPLSERGEQSARVLRLKA